MVNLPAFCDRCGSVFPSGLDIEGISIAFHDVSVGRCPSCGGVLRIPDGDFDLLDKTITILSAPDQSVRDLGRLADLLRSAKDKEQSHQDIADQVKRELPNLSRLADLLPKNRTQLYAFLMLLVATIDLLIRSPGQVTVNQMIQQVIVTPEMAPTSAAPSMHVERRTGRNDPCPCGSGRKFKKCCGAPR